jgi:hypothetical protein
MMAMLTIEKTVLPSPEQWQIIIEGMRNPMNSWDKMDSGVGVVDQIDTDTVPVNVYDYVIGENDHGLMERLAKGGAVHAKYRRMIPVYVTINAPFYWWKEFDTYKVGTVCNSCSTMHKIHSKEFTLDDFSTEHLLEHNVALLYEIIGRLNEDRCFFLEHGDKDDWWQLIQMLPTSYNQKRTVMLNYEVLVNIYHSRKGHKLDEWHTFCDWIEGLPYADLITGVE